MIRVKGEFKFNLVFQQHYIPWDGLPIHATWNPDWIILFNKIHVFGYLLMTSLKFQAIANPAIIIAPKVYWFCVAFEDRPLGPLGWAQVEGKKSV